ncbi:hypothetical protein A2673_03415 [Candidatus Kaiserbacteria bacterium RIFCSPHIGHO2_01_FULL_50_13]|nr:MAG: hypothetical protein A2673_03415 [Candidatus Kaiserbacteria bacterium RIFCSPHIGHO2_01_FULL_50_13]OGG81614.1 MAG: hypothetical protein A3H74_01375 [Candidatus Kaiserbacteria bacterium RIFCSPLOWO2_02_FULL_51_13]
MVAAIGLFVALPLFAYAEDAPRECLTGGAAVEKLTHRFVVKLYAVGNPEKPQESATSGSGELVRNVNGTVRILTNAHVVGSARHVWVHFDGELFSQKVQVLGVDPLIDLALLEAPKPLPLSVEPIAFSAEPVVIGDCLYAVGYPDGNKSITPGVVASLVAPAFVGVRRGLYFSHIAPISPGSSGGAVVRFSNSGALEFLGINTIVGVQSSVDEVNKIVKTTVSNFGFALHARVIRRAMEVLERTRLAEHGYMGLGLDDAADMNPFIFEAIANRSYPPNRPGIVVTDVVPESPAAGAGILAGDMIRSFEVYVNERWLALLVENATRLAEEVFFSVPPGTSVRVSTERGEQTFVREFSLSSYPSR